MNIRKIGLLGAVLLSGGVVPAYAVDTWSTTKGVLNIPLVQYGTKTYQNVTAVLGGVISVGSTCSSSSTAADTLSSTTGQLTIPAVTVTTTTGSTTYCNASVWLSSITSVGGVCADAASCSQYFTPVSYASTMPRSYAPSLTLVSSLTNRARYLVSNTATATTSSKYLTIGNDYNNTVASGYAATTSTLPLSSTYKTYLNKLIQVLQVADNGTNATVYNITTTGYSNFGYRLDSHLHPNESIDVDTANGNKLKFVRNIGGPATPGATLASPEPTSTGFVAFSYDTAAHTLRAVKRYTRSVVQDTSSACTKAPCYNASFTIDSSFALANYYVNFDAATGVYSLVQSSGSATPFYFYSSSDGYAVPSIMNPTNTAYTTTNPPAAFPSNANATSVESTFSLAAKYTNQISVGGVKKPGANADTKAAADAFLATINTTLAGNSSTLCNGEIPSGTATGDLPQAAMRYSPAVYTAFRDALLSGTLVSDAVADGTPNQRLVPFVYFTNEADSNGCYHPFMNIITYSQASGPHGLLDIPVPPAAGANTAGVGMTRLTNLVSQTTRIPMRNYGNVNTTNLTAINNGANVPNFDANLYCDKQYPVGATRDACAAASNASGDPYNWASSNDNGISYDGAQTFPIMNASVIPSSWKAELSTYGCHVGQGGGGAHCHADGYAAGTTKQSLYGDNDYVGKTHPPLVAFGYDGIATFGRYRTQDSSMLGASVPLDAFAGHDHDGIGYHYHAREGQMPVSPVVYTYTANGKTICSALDPSCVAGNNYSGGTATPTPVSTLVQGAWKANLKNTPCFRGGNGSATSGNPIWGSTACNAFLGK